MMKLILSMLMFLCANILLAQTNVAQRAVSVSNSLYIVQYEYCPDESPKIVAFKRYNDSLSKANKEVSSFETVAYNTFVSAKVTVYEIGNGTTNMVGEKFDGYYVEGTSSVSCSQSDVCRALSCNINRINMDLAKNEK